MASVINDIGLDDFAIEHRCGFLHFCLYGTPAEKSCTDTIIRSDEVKDFASSGVNLGRLILFVSFLVCVRLFVC